MIKNTYSCRKCKKKSVKNRFFSSFDLSVKLVCTPTTPPVIWISTCWNSTLIRLIRNRQTNCIFAYTLHMPFYQQAYKPTIKRKKNVKKHTNRQNWFYTKKFLIECAHIHRSSIEHTMRLSNIEHRCSAMNATKQIDDESIYSL